MKTIGHNTKVDSISDYNGIVFRSNYEKSYTDLSPAFDFEEFKNLINKENQIFIYKILYVKRTRYNQKNVECNERFI